MNQLKRSVQKRRPSPRPALRGEARIVEELSLTPNTTAAGVVSTLSELRPAILIPATRLAGYQAVYDEIRIDRVVITWVPLYGAGAGGRICVYIDRDITDGTVATVDLAVGQQEKIFVPFSRGGTMTWIPREPTDREFQPLNPGTVSLARIHIIGESLTDGSAVAIPNATDSGTLHCVTYATVRGRP